MRNRNKNTVSAAAGRKNNTHLIGGGMNFAASEAYKLLRTNLMFSFSETDRCNIIGMTSAFRGEGKSLTSINLAYTFAEAKKRVLLIEGDMRLPTMARRLELKSTPGLSNLIAGMSGLREVVQTFKSEAEGQEAVSFHVLVSGDIPPNPSELLGSGRMKVFLDSLRYAYDYVILDLPPVTVVTDAVLASKLVDGMVVVVRSDHAVRGALSDTIRQLRLVDAKILGFVFNGASESGGGYYRGKSYYKKDKYYYKK